MKHDQHQGSAFPFPHHTGSRSTVLILLRSQTSERILFDFINATQESHPQGDTAQVHRSIMNI